MDIKDITEIVYKVMHNPGLPFRDALLYAHCEDAAREIVAKEQETFIQEIAVLDLKPNSILVLHSNEPHTDTVKDTLFAMRKVVRERFPELKDTAILILRPGDDIKLLDEKQMNEVGWYKHRSLGGERTSYEFGGIGGVDDVS